MDSNGTSRPVFERVSCQILKWIASQPTGKTSEKGLSAAASFLVIGCRKDILNRKARQIAYTTSIVPHGVFLSYETKTDQMMKVSWRWTARKSEVVAMKLDVLKVNCLSQTTQEKTQEFWHPTNTKLQNVLPWSWSVPRGSIAILQDFRHKIRFQWFSSLCTVTQYHLKFKMNHGKQMKQCNVLSRLVHIFSIEPRWVQVTIESQQGSSTRHQIWGVPITGQDETQRCRNASASLRFASLHPVDQFIKLESWRTWWLDGISRCQVTISHKLHHLVSAPRSSSTSQYMDSHRKIIVLFSIIEMDRGNCFLHYTLTRLLYILGTLHRITLYTFDIVRISSIYVDYCWLILNWLWVYYDIICIYWIMYILCIIICIL